MALAFAGVRVHAHDPQGQAAFWAGLLGWRIARSAPDGVVVRPTDGTAYGLRFVASDEPKTRQNRVHLDLTSASRQDMDGRVETALRSGGEHCDVGQGPDETHVVLADPEGNEFCVVPPENTFLAGCGLIGALNCEGRAVTGYFWHAALGWPLVWDQDEETAVQAPGGGTKITWSGPPIPPKAGTNRLCPELSAPAAELRAETARLVGLGARVLDDAGDVVVLADPDENEFFLRTSD
ncbi:VOC family protein [Myceligenerans crystallogenes]|uniref:VOC family protein n=1 Tax=Myceligenerans crystallogenes TaxID=316335 RepID=A0ABN2N6X7_9MICO